MNHADLQVNDEIQVSYHHAGIIKVVDGFIAYITFDHDILEIGFRDGSITNYRNNKVEPFKTYSVLLATSDKIMCKRIMNNTIDVLTKI